MKRILSVITSLLLCFSTWAQQIVLTDSMKTDIKDGAEWAYLHKGPYVVGLSNNPCKDDYGHYYQLQIIVYNLSGNDVIFIPDSVKSTILKGQEEAELKVYTYEKMTKKIKREQFWTEVITAAGNGFAAGSSSTNTTYNPYTGGFVSSYDPTPSMLATQQLTLMDMAFDNDLKVRQQGYLRANTIHPHEAISGYMNIKYKKGDFVNVIIPVGEQCFRFTYSLAKKKHK